MSKINVRSPYYIHIAEQYLTSAKLELYIYTGTQTTDRGSVKYTINTVAGLDNKLTFEISELVRDYIETTFDGSYTSSAVWVDYQITRTLQTTPQTPDAFVQLTGFDGYGYFEEGANPQNNEIALQSNSKIITNDLADVRVPVYVTSNTTVTYFKDGEEVLTKVLTSSSETDDQIQYADTLALNSDYWRQRVLNDGGEIEAFSCVQDIVDDVYEQFDVDTIQIEQGGTVQVISVEEVEECKYTPYKITFVNKFGALQDIWFFKRSNLTLSTTKETYKGNIVVDGTYSIHSRQNTVFNKQGTEKLQLNTGFYPESYNEIFRQLSLSEELWITYEGYAVPVTLLSSDLAYKTGVDDKVINYTIDVEFTNNKINNIR